MDLPYSHAAMRGVKAEGGWAAVCTEILSIHPSSDSTPYPQVKLWDADDERSLRLLTDAVHEHGAYAGAELAHGGWAVANRYTREPLLSPTEIPSRRDPIQARAMDKADIAEYRRWHKPRGAAGEGGRLRHRLRLRGRRPRTAAILPLPPPQPS